jgi:hypothetical protein
MPYPFQLNSLNYVDLPEGNVDPKRLLWATGPGGLRFSGEILSKHLALA